MAHPPRIERITLDCLFHPDAPSIVIQLGGDQPVTALYGRNGAGKSLTLDLIAAAREGDYARLVSVPFTRLRFDLEDGGWMEWRNVGHSPYGTGTIEVEWPGDGEVVTTCPPSRHGLADRRSMRRNGVEIDAHGFAMDESGRSLTYAEVTQRLPEVVLTVDDASEALDEAVDLLPHVKHVEADRLFIRTIYDTGLEPRVVPTVDHLSERIRETLEAADLAYRQTSTRLDASLPTRLFAGGPAPDAAALGDEAAALKEQEQRLVALNLLPEVQEIPLPDDMTTEQRRTLHIILQDRKEKLGAFREIVDKAERLVTTLNARFAPKTLRLDLERGYSALTARGEPLPLSSLSSGEQHELVLQHELLFDVPAGSLVLIDEPELSLHVDWQVRVVPDLEAIAALTGHTFVLATHSPYIVDAGSPRMVRLGDGVDGDR